uniref:NADH-ubiquinone oxidoreductase chain 5 n=1 Tax=Dicranocentrus wangi TaxID=1302322 RepID=A0A6H0EY25_9HEXA|nr:NADH dehydrogenase subunit 5 [Dicranocentrus wangi]QIT06439.1 NADH dehydrogenase subunit 5 [Dicranocentrus wangi]
MLSNYLSVTYYLGFMMLWCSFVSFFYGVKYYLVSLVIFIEWEVFSFFGSSVVMTILFDWMSLTFMSFVLFISSMVLMYSSSYMQGDKFLYRFIILVYLFVLSMLFLIISPNLVSILLGWDGLGLVSYCLVIYYQNVKSANAGMLTILSNRVGDVALLLSIAWLINFGSWNFYYIQAMYTEHVLLFVLFMVILAGMTKSAQIPFSAWLPAAMAAPTPVSALVHSSTLVTAGVYLLIRFNVLLNTNMFLFYVGCFTMFMSGLGANFEMDLKKIIALSTLSQLGVMMMILSLGFSELSFFHLLSHALFKSLLFLCAGVFIHGMSDIQDIRYLGGVMGGCPLSSLFFIGCSLSLCGFPFLSGFYSKDTILEVYMMGFINIFMVVVIILGTLFTATYSVRLSFFLFFKNLGLKSLVSLEESDVMSIPMSFLFLMAISAGSLMSWFYFPCYSIFLPLAFSIFVLLNVIFWGVLIYVFMSCFHLFYLSVISYVSHYMGTMWFMPIISTYSFMPLLSLGNFLIKYLDQGWVELFGGQGVHYFFSKTSLFIDKWYFLNLKSYFFLFFIFLLFILFML